MKIVVAAPVQQRPSILRPFLDGLLQQASPLLDVHHVFVDDNHDDASSHMLQQFARDRPGTVVVDVDRAERYVCDDATTHAWKEDLVWRVAAMKDAMIEHALEVDADALFFVDSDLVLRPGTLAHLARQEKDIVSEVFWTRWHAEGPLLPQVWLTDVYGLAATQRGETITADEAAARTEAFLRMLRTPGVYPVGGLGACTLISRRALEGGVRFAEIPNLSFWGEDRHFCIRAAALGFALHADTHLPPLHLYRESDLSRLSEIPAGPTHGTEFEEAS
ncbi:glycosyltransferase [Quadrisphaera sp. INWT6]|uniref:glycosyltransferase n=1 Tax=Quadrisphaera sp. INWT6 TaxID=2596917 RepID=UPI0018925649|nr:glycosyltransferase [Quadrisphaera sp. INWT6]MBF5083139.1 glycosyltransferase family 2 protein [Quadrisphaera sp. INWT6]